MPNKAGRDGFDWFDPTTIKIATDHGTKERETLFKNPRPYNNPGWSPQEMSQLRTNIARVGLNQPLEVRKVGKTIQLIAGERRLRCILELIRTKTPCYNTNKKKTEPADVVYKEVCCRVHDASDDKYAIRQAVLENLLHHHLTDFELLLQCQRMEEAGYTRAEQAEDFDISEAWISQSHSLLNSNKRILDYMEKGLLGRTQALLFLKVSPDKIDEVLTGAIQENIASLEAKEREALQAQDAAYDQIEQCETDISDAQIQGQNAKAGEAKKKMLQAEKEASLAAKKLTSIRKQKGKRKITVENIDAAAKKAGVADNLTDPQSTRLVGQVVSQLEELLESGEALLNPNTKKKYDRAGVVIVKRTLDWVLNKHGMEHPLEALEDLEYEGE